MVLKDIYTVVYTDIPVCVHNEMNKKSNSELVFAYEKRIVFH